MNLLDWGCLVVLLTLLLMWAVCRSGSCLIASRLVAFSLLIACCLGVVCSVPLTRLGLDLSYCLLLNIELWVA